MCSQSRDLRLDPEDQPQPLCGGAEPGQPGHQEAAVGAGREEDWGREDEPVQLLQAAISLAVGLHRER